MRAAAPAGEFIAGAPFRIDVSAKRDDENIGEVGPVSEPLVGEEVGVVLSPGVTTGSPFPSWRSVVQPNAVIDAVRETASSARCPNKCFLS